MRKKRHPILKTFLTLALLCSALLADSNLRVVTTEYTLRFPALPREFDGLRIAQLSDVHGAVYGRNNASLLERVREAEPDLIAVTGDLADDTTRLTDVDTLLEGLCAIAPVYYVSGNHEWTAGLIEALQAIFERHGVRYLRNEYVTLGRGGAELILAGVEDPNGWRDQPKPDAVADGLPEGFRVLLGHRNYWIWNYPALPVDLILCGHAHGGVIRLPFLGGVLDHYGPPFPDYTDGVYRSGRYDMVVSRGLGNTGGVPRFLNNPELVIVTLKSQ